MTLTTNYEIDFSQMCLRVTPDKCGLASGATAKQTSQGSAKILSLIEWTLNEKSGEMKK